MARKHRIDFIYEVTHLDGSKQYIKAPNIKETKAVGRFLNGMTIQRAGYERAVAHKC